MAQPVDGESGGHLWADRFDRNLTDFVAPQDEVVRNIVDALAIKLTRWEKQLPGARANCSVAPRPRFTNTQ
ncbi:hypothetical protein [Reyranella soli]|nr:hypothetical protein [Reyranella soli]